MPPNTPAGAPANPAASMAGLGPNIIGAITLLGLVSVGTGLLLDEHQEKMDSMYLSLTNELTKLL